MHGDKTPHKTLGTAPDGSLEPEALPEAAAVPLRPLAGRPGSEGFARTFARHSRPSLRHLLPGRRVWVTGVIVGSLTAAGFAAPGLLQRSDRLAPHGAVAAEPDGGATRGSTADPDATAAPNATATGTAGKPSGSPTTAPASAPAAKGTATRAAEGTARPPGISYTAWSGPGCPVPKGGGYREQNRDRDKGWFSVRTGGWTEKGCDGSFTSVPMSGDPGADARNRVVWWWSVGEAKRCDLAVYVPDDPESTHVGGHPTTYLVLSDPRDESSRYGRFEIDQTNTTSKTIRAGSFPVKGGRLAVMMLDRGENHWSDGTVPHHAASQIRITCRR